MFGSLILSLLFMSSAETYVFSANEKACFEALAKTKLSPFRASRQDEKIYVVNGTPVFLNHYFELGYNSQQVRDLARNKFIGFAQVENGRILRVCIKRGDGSMISCVKEVETPLNELARKQIFKVVSDSAWHTSQAESSKALPEVALVNEISKVCSGVDDRLSTSLAQIIHLDEQRLVGVKQRGIASEDEEEVIDDYQDEGT